uniref:Uncharacterized protein n=1 Tax=Cyprinus carpio TaxID=7962 RepID=A0A8C2L218_CYPCA
MSFDITSPFPPSGNEGYVRNRDVTFLYNNFYCAFVGQDEEAKYTNTWRTDVYGYERKFDNVPGPNITVYRQTEDREHVIVLCKFGMTHRWQSIELSVESELKYTIEQCTLYYSEMCVFLVTVRPPASFTCVHENLRSQTYNYSGSVSDHPEEGASLSYICFSSFIAVGLFIMTAAVIVINIRSKTKDTNSTAVTDNDYVEV